MGLDNLNKRGDKSGTSRRYVKITRDEFEEFLDSTDLEWKAVDSLGKEIVYETEDAAPDYDVVTMRIFSSIDQRTGVVRDKGADAIRLVLWNNLVGAPVSGMKKTLRIETWKKNLREKVVDLYDKSSKMVKECPECGSILVRREGKYGDFLGCSNYPECDYTENV